MRFLLVATTIVGVLADRPLTDLYKARDVGGGGQYAPVSFWGPNIITTTNNVTLAWAQADRSPIGHDAFIQLRRSRDGGRTWEPAYDLSVNSSPPALYSKSTGKLFMFPGLSSKPYTVSAMPCELDMAWNFDAPSGELTQVNATAWGPLGLSSCARSAVGKPGTVLGIAGLECEKSSFQWNLTAHGQLLHTASQLCATIPVDHWGYPLSAMLMQCGSDGICPCVHGSCNCSQQFEWQQETGMLRMRADTQRSGWCFGVRTSVAGPLDPPQHPPLDKGQTACHLAMMASCNKLRFRPSLPACNACLAAHQANLSAAGCDDPKNKRDFETFCGTEPIEPPVPAQKWDPSYQAMIVTSTDDGLTWSEPKKMKVTNTWNKAYIGGTMGHGFELEHSAKYRGRLVQAHDYNADANDPVWKYNTRDFVLYSDDQGETWTAGQLLPWGWGEAGLTELKNGSLLLTARLSDGYLEMDPPLMRGFARSDDGGETWAEWWYLEDRQPEVLTTTCSQPIVADHETGIVYYGHPGAVNASRTNYTVHRSLDGGASWQFVERITAHGSGYSDMNIVPQPNGSKVLAVLFQRTLWEDGVEGGGYNLAWATIPL